MGDTKRKRNSPPFIMIQKKLLASPEYARLSPKAIKLLLDVWAQYNGSNNGDLSATWSLMRKRGWNSSSTLDDAKKELVAGGWLELTRQGGRNKCNLYALSLYSIDECKRKHDEKPTRKPSNLWQDKIRNCTRISNQPTRISNQSGIQENATARISN